MGSKHEPVVNSLKEASHTVNDTFAAGVAATDASAVAAPPKQAKPKPSAGTCIQAGWHALLHESNDKRRVSVQTFKGEPFVDIRGWYGAEPEMKPGKKGIMLSLKEWQGLKAMFPAVDEQIGKMSE